MGRIGSWLRNAKGINIETEEDDKKECELKCKIKMMGKEETGEVK
jgi:hypothetical protein